MCRTELIIAHIKPVNNCTSISSSVETFQKNYLLMARKITEIYRREGHFIKGTGNKLWAYWIKFKTLKFLINLQFH